MKYFTYIIYSKSLDKYYIGYTHDLVLRVSRHNDGSSRSTKSGIPWILVYYEEFDSKSEAIKRKNFIKRKKSRDFIEKIIRDTGGRPDPACRLYAEGIAGR